MQEATKLINDSKNIYLLSSKSHEASVCALALFYTLKELGKNVNLISDQLPENLRFLSPSLDFVSYPKNFVISVPSNIAQISQIYYEKNDDALKIYLTLEGGILKKDNISFYFSETKPDLTITIGIKDYSKELQNNLNSFGFLLDSPILNIDNGPGLVADPMQTNKKFGKINIIENTALAKTVSSLINALENESIKKEPATCLLAGLILYTDNFKSKVTAEIFELASKLMKKGANLEEIVKNIYRGSDNQIFLQN